MRLLRPWKVMSRVPIIINSKIMGGVPVIQGTRIPVFVILDYLADGYSMEDIIIDFPALDIEDIRATIAFASGILKQQFIKGGEQV